MRVMKRLLALGLGMAGVALFAGCASTPVALSKVGPNPTAQASATADGRLEVFSAMQRQRDGNEYDIDPAWYQHTDYEICDAQGRPERHVFNTVAHYSSAPRVVNLPAGNYIVRARAKGYLRVSVPLEIKPGRTTRLHLDATWKPPPGTPANEIVKTPAGYAIGWRTIS